ncbi:MAG: PHP domain-containing protein [Methylococcales bacterium]|nr:PHP domain-containing protein [Methylococcales bacterium]MDD5753951.1 PHP domain-containing protein [Methylococcales bacterium]
MTQLYDLHCHSTASDGALSPTELVKRAAENAVTTLALTDHDTTDGLIEARACADELHINFVNGIELSVQWEKQCLHIVGLNIQPQHEVLQKVIAELHIMRTERAEKIALKLAKKGIPDALAAVQGTATNETITRVHFANFLVSQAYVSTVTEAFDRYLGDGKVAYVSTTWTPLETAIQAILAAGGIPVVAHPLRYNLTATRMRKLLGAFKNAGGQAIEVVTGRYNPDEMRVLANYATQFELSGSVGSDFHSPTNQWIELGRLAVLPVSIKPVWELWQ